MSALEEHQKAVDRVDEFLREVLQYATGPLQAGARIARGELFSVSMWLRSTSVEEAFIEDLDECAWVADDPCPVCFPESTI